MAKLNPAFHGLGSFFAEKGNNLFNLKTLNELKKDQTNIKIFKSSSFDSNFNSVQSLNTNLSHLFPASSSASYRNPTAPSVPKEDVSSKAKEKDPVSYFDGGSISAKSGGILLRRSNKNIINPKLSAILRAIRSIRLNRDEWKLIRYINLMEKKIRSSPLFDCSSPTPSSSSPANLRVKAKKEGAQNELPYFAVRSESSCCEASSCFAGCFSYGGEASFGSEGGVERARGGVLSKLSQRKKGNLDSKFLLKGKKEVTKYFIKQNSKTFCYNNIINKNILLRNMKYNFLKSTLSSILKKKIRKISEVLEDKPIKNYVLYSYLNNCITCLGQQQSSSSFVTEGGAEQGTSLHLNGRRTKLSLNKYKGRKLGSFINYNKIIGYKFNSSFYQAASPAPKEQEDKHPALLEAGGCSSYEVSCFSYGGCFAAEGATQLKGLEKSRGNLYIKDTYKLLFYLFKSMYCLISKPVLKYSNDKVTIQLFYYLNIPKKKVFRLFSIFYINSIKKKWLALIEKKKNRLISPALRKGGVTYSQWHPKVGNTKIYIRWKLRKAISRFKNKNKINLLFKLRKYNLTALTCGLRSNSPASQEAVLTDQNKFKLICAILSNKFNKPVELQLIRLHHPYHDSNILVNLLSLNFKNKRKKARVAIQKIYNKKPVKNLNDPNLKSGKLIPAFLSGLNIKIAGRLMGEPIIPRITNKVFGKGATATGKINYLDVARITKKNRKGAYTIKITSGQNFF